MIKNIIFDLSEVIISGYYGVEKILGDLLDMDYNKVDNVLKGNSFLELMEGKVSEDEYIYGILKNTKWDIKLEKFKEIIRKNHNIEVVGTMGVIKKLKGKYKLILLSDHVEEWVQDILSKNNELEIFDKMYFSYELKSLKTDANTFKKVVKESNIKIEETIFIDDSKDNIKVSKMVGIDGILFENSEQLEKELIKRKLL